MCSNSLRPSCEFCSTGTAPSQMQARNAAANSTELVIRNTTLSSGFTRDASLTTNTATISWNSALLTAPSAERNAG